MKAPEAHEGQLEAQPREERKELAAPVARREALEKRAEEDDAAAAAELDVARSSLAEALSAASAALVRMKDMARDGRISMEGELAAERLALEKATAAASRLTEECFA